MSTDYRNEESSNKKISRTIVLSDIVRLTKPYKLADAMQPSDIPKQQTKH